MINEVQNQDGKELAERIKADLAEIHHRFEISDPRYDAKYKFYTAEAVTAKADEIGATRFQGRTADGQVSQISKVDGEWKRSDGKSLADIQEEIDKDSAKAIETRAEQRAAAGHGVDAETDKQQALIDARDFRRIQNPDWQDKAAEIIAENSRANPNYSAFDAAVAAARVEEKTAPGVVQIAENENTHGVPMQSMPGKTMTFNDQPGRRGAEIVDEEGSRIVFGGKGEIDRFAQEHKLSPEDVQTLKELDSRKYSTPSAVQIAENENTHGVPMQSMPGTLMIYNDQPGRQGVEVWKKDGSHIAFGSKEAIDRFAQEHKLSPEDVQTLKELDSRKDNSPTNKPQENIIAINERSQEQDQTDKKKAKQDITQDIPDTVSNRYLRVEDKYYMLDKTVAFEDRGNNLKLETENHTVIRDALAIAETRGWQSISVSGSQNFKQQVWREASLKGMEVVGYKPTQLEMAEVSKAITLRDARKEVGDNQKQQDSEMRGVLLAHGADHYKHDPNQGQSYFVKLDIDGKEVTNWGTDFKRAFEDSQTKPQVGEALILSNIGKQSVEIPTTVVDEHGNVIEDKKTVNKTTWRIVKASHQDTLQEQADALRVGKEIERKVIEQMPQLAAALAVSKLGEKIAQQAKETGALQSQDEVDTIVKLIREGLASALEKGKHIKTPEILEQGKHAAIDANNIINDHKPPEIVKEPQQQDMAMTR